MRILKILCTFFITLLSTHLSAQSKIISDSTNDDNIVFTKAEQEASFPGGLAAWTKFLQKALANFNPADNGAPVGKYQVIARFIVGKDGSVKDITPETHFGYDMETKVSEALAKSGNWVPAVQNGRPVNAYRRQPVTFIVDSEEFEIVTEVPYTLYTNAKNPITVKAKNVKPENIGINVMGGKVTSNNQDGTFTIFVPKPGRVTIEVVNTKKNDKVIGTASIEAVEKK